MAIKRLMKARLAVRNATNEHEVSDALELVHTAKVELGERGPVWWNDGAVDFSDRHPTDTPYADWWLSLPEESRMKAE